MMTHRTLLPGLAVSLALMAPLASAQPAPACAPDRAIFQRPDGSTVTLTLEVVDTAETRARGLMFRKALPAEHGMLFIYEAPQPVAFWMKNTLIPLDMLFIDEAGRVAHTHRGAVPHDETPIPGAAPDDPAPDRLMVLEIAGGEAEALDLTEGAVLAHPGIPQDRAALPCAANVSLRDGPSALEDARAGA